MCCLTVIVSHSLTRGWNLQGLIRVPAGPSIHKFLMRSLSCWILKVSGVAEVVLVGGQESFQHSGCFPLCQDNTTCSFLPKEKCSTTVTTKHIKERTSICVTGALLCVCVCVCTCLRWIIHSQVLLYQSQLCRKETLSGYHCTHRTLTSSPCYATDVCFLCLQKENMAGRLQRWQGYNTEDRVSFVVAQFFKTS